ncbi:phage portal protein [Haloactinopolyspora alba]|uniref:phage portal protein n=1 Tax=Haloactinopolyspora alba TaxID=648780 RepID=UPI00197AF300|nr:phage portal protein [Haloactinopolyspora alba]
MRARAEELLCILHRDREAHDGLMACDRYIKGDHDDPYMPKDATKEYKLLAKRSVTNLVPLVIATPAQGLYVDGVRTSDPESDENAQEWAAWQRSGMDKRQGSLYRGAFGYGHSFVLTEAVEDNPRQGRMRVLSPLRTAVGYDDPVNDDAPLAAIHVKRWPRHVKRDDKESEQEGIARYWDEVDEYEVRFKSFSDITSVTRVGPHGNSECPVERFAPHVDLDGRTTGLVGPLIPLQDRINQTVFDLLVAQTFGSFKVRYVTGMEPSYVLDPETGEPKLDDNGQPIEKPVRAHLTRFMMAESPDSQFGELGETPLDGYISAIDMGIRHLAAIEQIPPHHLLGQVANLSAEALNAAETALARKIEEFQHSFGESWERVFRLVGELEGNAAQAGDFGLEVVWRDMGAQSLAQTSDALGKLHQLLGVPQEGLWRRVPGVTPRELEEWRDLRAAQPDVALANGNRRATAPRETPAEPEGLSGDVIPPQPSTLEVPAA